MSVGSYHMRELDVSETVDEGLAEVGELMQQRVILLLYNLVFLLDGLQVSLHGGDLAGERERDRDKGISVTEHMANARFERWQMFLLEFLI